MLSVLSSFNGAFARIYITTNKIGPVGPILITVKYDKLDRFRFN